MRTFHSISGENTDLNQEERDMKISIKYLRRLGDYRRHPPA